MITKLPNAVPETTVMAFMVDGDQVDQDGVIGNKEDDTFTGAYIRANDGTKILGTFTCGGGTIAHAVTTTYQPRSDDYRVLLDTLTLI